MNKRKRKKWLKKHNKYVNPKDTWNLDEAIAEFVIPRLELLDKVTNCYPGRGDAATPEQWHEILQKMIKAFKTHVDMVNYDDKYFDNGNFNIDMAENDKAIVKEGLHLFADWFGDLWW